MKLLQYICYAFAAATIFTGCTKSFKDYNTDPTGVTKDQADADFYLLSIYLHQAQRFIIPQTTGDYQTGMNLSSDAYAGYLAAEAPFVSNSNNLTYNLVDGWNARVWTLRYSFVMNPTYKTIELAAANPEYKDLDAFARIIRVSAMARVAEKIGPIIYSQYNIFNSDNFISYDKQEDVYPLFFKDLETAINTLKGLKTSAVSPQFKKCDLAYTANNYDNWLRFANTLRLRLAMRLAYIKPDLAKTQGEAALDPANGGLLADNSQNCFINLTVPHPLNVIGYEWSDTRMAAPMESIMGGYNDPRIEKYFEPSTDPVVAGQYKGIRAGIQIDAKARYDAFSKVDFITRDRMQIMVAAEAWFLKAEAALRGWSNAGDAKTNYETGIARSFEMHGVADKTANYINDATSKPKPYIDPKAVTPGQNDVLTGSPHLSTITIKWNDADTRARKLEKIITQKWIALFPDGEEAWAEYRRTGYPILFPVVVNLSAGAIPTIPGVRRLPIPIIEYNTNGGAAKAGEATLGGPNTGATRLWWDVADKSF